MIVETAGPLTTVQDLGRPGYAHLGVPRSGALDRPALLLANRLVGNPPDAAGLEITLGPFTATLHRAGTIALTGAAAPLRVGGRPAPLNAPVPVRAGDRIEVGPAVLGLRAYLAVAGGLQAAAVLTSRSTDTLSSLGPPVVRAGAVLPIGRCPGEPAAVDVAPRPALGGEITLRITWGPRADRFTDAFVLGTSRYHIGTQSNRIGARLTGRSLTRADAEELPSEGIVLGAVQVPANGQPLVFLADHPMRRVSDRALTLGVRVGAQVSYRDLAGFGRRRIDVPPGELEDELRYQIGALSAFGTVSYVKPHGALYNTAAVEAGHASAVVAAAGSLPVLCQPGSVLAGLASEAGLRVVAEGFVDRGYLPDGRLVPRSAPGALLTDVELVAARSVRMALDGVVEAVDGSVIAMPVESLCVHGDTPGAVSMARAVRTALIDAGVEVSPFVPTA